MPDSEAYLAAVAPLSGLPGFEFLPEHDRREIEHFRRFLGLAGVPGENSGFLRVHRGWLPYVLGHFFWSGVYGPHTRSLAPPEGYDDVPVTAWTFPG